MSHTNTFNDVLICITLYYTFKPIPVRISNNIVGAALLFIYLYTIFIIRFNITK